MKKKTPPKGGNQKISVKLDAKTSMFFCHLIHEGIADFKVDSTMNDGEVRACMEKNATGKKLTVRAKTAIAWHDDDDDDD